VRKTKKIYIVEDNLKNLKLFKAVLNQLEEVELYTETRGELGLELIKSGDPDLIILDIKLPEISGIDIIKELQKIEKFKETPIIAVTSYALKGDKEKILEAGFTEYISKPIKIKAFKHVINSYLK
jgi:CheY-like chemotaxis protein